MENGGSATLNTNSSCFTYANYVVNLRLHITLILNVLFKI